MYLKIRSSFTITKKKRQHTPNVTELGGMTHLQMCHATFNLTLFNLIMPFLFLCQDAGQILCHACRLVPLQDNLLVTKVCQLIVIITHQKVGEKKRRQKKLTSQ